MTAVNIGIPSHTRVSCDTWAAGSSNGLLALTSSEYIASEHGELTFR